MKNLSRRNLLASIAMTGAASLVPAAPAQTSPASTQPLSKEARKAAADKLVAYCAANAPKLLRPAEGILQHPSISPSFPGKEYSTSLWDWDTLWTARGLFRTATLTSDSALRAKVAEHAQGSLLNFLDHQAPDGRLPILLDIKSADPLGSLIHGDPASRNQAKPIFSQLALLVADETKDVSWLAPRFNSILRFYDSWAVHNRSNGLYVWGNDVAIGNDNDPTTFGRPEFSSANLLLNCLFYQDLLSASRLAELLRRFADAQRLGVQAFELGQQIQKLCWDPRDRFYYTADVQCIDRRAELIPTVKRGMDMSWHTLPLRIQTFTGFLPLWCGLAQPEQAKSLLSHALNPQTFHSAAGIRSLSAQETMYSLDFSSNPSNWLGPVWIIVNYLVWRGLTNYKFTDAANDLADKTLSLLASDLTATGSLNEYYHPDTAKPLSHAGFMDWNLLVLEMIQP
jgi:putative isomerase